MCALRLTARLLDTASEKADRAARLWLITAMAGMAVLVAVQVFARYALNESLFWSEELGRILLVQLTFIGCAVAVRAGAHPGMDALVRHLPRRGRHVTHMLVLLAALAFFALLAWHGARFAWFVRHQSTPALGLSRLIPALPLPVGGALSMLHVLAILARHATGDRQGGGDDGLADHASDTPSPTGDRP